ncbi:MAG TPA: diguanylate cyclase [Terracidiphilus sp.]|nr:diguanylate cyclase [Terracidiphilus sp.]
MENKQARSVLLIEHQTEQTSQIRVLLDHAASGVFQLAHVESICDAEKHLVMNPVEVVLLDLEMPESNLLEAVRRVQKTAPHAAIVLLCDSDDEPIAVHAIQQGAQDYLVKGQIEPRALKRALFNAVERKTLEDIQLVEKERAQVTLDCIGDAVISTDARGNITFMNPVAERMTGWQLKDAAGRMMADCVRIVDAGTRRAILDPMAKAANQNRTGTLPLNSTLIGRDGREVNIEDSVAPIHDHEGQVTGAVIVFRDVSATRALEKELTNSAHHDFLTGLPNRMLLNDRIGQAIALAHRQGVHAAVLFLDLDGFKQVNDSLGHPIGDKLLQSVANRMLECVRSPDTVVRQGGDEFIVLLQELKHPQDAVFTVARLLKTVASMHSVDSHEICITASIGVSIYPSDGQDGETLIRNADIAMYYAKKNGSQSYRFFRPEMVREGVAGRPDGQDIWYGLDSGTSSSPHRRNRNSLTPRTQ